MNICIIIPTYNNASTILNVARRSLSYGLPVYIVNDGSTDNTPQQLATLQQQIRLISYISNRGKGHALKCALRAARRDGFSHAITIDSDGQHNTDDIAKILALAGEQTTDKFLIIGSRNLAAHGMPASNTFANRFSNFWFALQTGLRLPDTQTGLRLYPLHHLPSLALITSRYEGELELLVLSAWRGVKLLPVSIDVAYPPDRVSHFRPVADFARISLLNTILCLLAIVYGYPRRLITAVSNYLHS